MEMARIRNDTRDRTSGRLVPAFTHRPDDFEQTFVRIGRQACEEHYGVGRLQVSKWLDECGKDQLTTIRREYVKRKEAERHAARRLSRSDIGKILGEAFREPIRGRRISITLARHAAQHLRIRRNGGWIVSPCPNGDWRVGTKRVSAEQLVDMARKAGFDPSLTGGGNTKLV